MNLLRIYGATLLIAMVVGVSACKSEEAPAPTPAPTTSEETAGEKKISFTANIEGLPDDDLRLMVQDSMVGNKHAGLKFTWKPGETEVLWIAFKKEGDPQGKLEVRKSSLTILEKEGKHYKARVDVNAPASLDAEKHQLIIAGAIGVSGINAAGAASVPGPRYFYDNGQSYSLPMYFAPTKLRVKVTPGSRDREYYADDLTFHFYGAMVGATIDNTQGNMLYSPHEVTFKTGALTTIGSINLFDKEEGSGLPKWTTTQDANATQRVYFEQGDVAVGKKRTYYFWAVPSKFEGRREMTMEFRTDAYDQELGETADEISTKWGVKQLAMGKVHRFQTAIPAPKGDLIISEVFIGGGDYGAATAWEFYNPTDVDINLKDYYIQRFDYNTKGNSASTWYPSSPTYESSLLPNAALLKNGPNSLDKSRQLGLKRGILPPHKSAVFYTASVVNKDMMKTFERRTGLVYLFNIVSETFRDLLTDGRERSEQKLEYAQAFFAPRFRLGGKQYRSRHRIVRKGADTRWGRSSIPVDAFFWYSNGIRAQYPTASFFRKPGRDLPRTEMQINHNSDWVMRQRYEALDWGYRFSYYYDRNRVKTPALGIHWMEDTSTGSTIPGASAENGYIFERPIFAPNYSKNDMSFDELKKDAQLYKYVPPMWWTKERAQKADKKPGENP